MRLLGIDYGEKRIGIAVSDPLGFTSQPVEVLENKKGVFAKIKQICEKFEVSKIIVGLPKTMRGEIGISASNVMSFIENLKRHVQFPIETFDERLTTSEAEKILINAGVSRQERKQVIDKMAAAYMLQAYMDLEKKKCLNI